MKVLGPYNFIAEGSSEENCGCGGDYCNKLNYGDKITFQIPAKETCYEFLSGCNILSADCIDTWELDSPFTYTQNSSSICFDLLVGEAPGQIEPGDYVFSGEYANFVGGLTYRVCFSFSNNTTPSDNFIVRIFDGVTTWDSPLIYSGNGNFCAYITLTGIGVISAQWGIVFLGGDDTVRMCMESLVLCQSKEYTLFIQGPEEQSIPITESENGNLLVSYGITQELPTGCYTMLLTDGADSWVSNCVNIQVSHGCTKLLTWRNRGNAFGYDYSNENYFNYARVEGRLKHPTWPTDAGEYLLSNNKNQLTNVQQSEVYSLALNDLPEYLLRAIASALVHSEFLIDGESYRFVPGDIIPTWRNSSELSPLVVQVINQDYDGINRYCG